MLVLYIPVNSFVHVGSPNHTFFLGKLVKAVNQYLVHILLLVTDNNPSRIRGKEENGSRHGFMINLCENMGPGRDQSHDPDMLLTALSRSVK